MSKYDDPDKPEELKRNDTISEEEFEREKTKILNSESPIAGTLANDNSYLMLMHLSQFRGLIVPLPGFVLPIVMWRMKDNNPEIDRHGKNITNFMLRMLIYAVVAIPLCFVIIGIPVLIALGVLESVFVIMAAVKANRGEYWKYPLSPAFFS